MPFEQFWNYLAILAGFPLLRASSSASSWASRSIRSASLLIRRERSKPVTFFPHVVLKAFRAAATATSMSFSEAKGSRRYQFHCWWLRRNSPATTEQINSSVAGLIALLASQTSTYRRTNWTDCISSLESMDDTNWLSMNNPVGTVIVLLRRGMSTVATSAMVVRRKYLDSFNELL